MNIAYNLYNLEASFKHFLIAENNSPITIKNYLSDFRYFSGWTINQFKIQNFEFRIDLIDEILIKKYKDYLIFSHLPQKSINRRLSTLRKFCSFCISQGWMKENPAKRIGNVRSIGKIHESSLQDNILPDFHNYLSSQNISQSDINSCLNDVQEMIEIINS
jgi:site-specific recombinase XerD